MTDADREARAQAWAALCQLLHVVARDDYPPRDDVPATLHAVEG